MRSLNAVALSLITTRMMAAHVTAQDIGLPMLVHNDGVRRELKLGDGQARRIDSISEAIYRRQCEGMSNLNAFPRSPTFHQDAKDLIRFLIDDFSRDLGDILSRAQSIRFGQIRLQRAGVGAFLEPHVGQTLKLTQGQESQIRRIRAELAKSLPRNGRLTGMTSESIAKLSKGAMGRAIAVLTDDQRRLWSVLTGEPFEVAGLHDIPDPPEPK